MVSGLPILAFGPLPGGERRLCHLIERWRIGCWVERPQHLAPLVSRLLSSPAERSCLRERAMALARRDAAHEAAAAILSWGYGPAR
jgi:UDP-N-acetylglucosamine:LPS N-acetylglucosamine transferase